MFAYLGFSMAAIQTLPLYEKNCLCPCLANYKFSLAQTKHVHGSPVPAPSTLSDHLMESRIRDRTG